MTPAGGFTDADLALLLDAVMTHYHAVEAVPQNDGTDLPAIEALQHKVEALLALHVEPGECEADATLVFIRDGICVQLVVNCSLDHKSESEAHYDAETGLFWHL